MSTALYSVGTWDTDEQAFTPQVGVPAFNLTLWRLRAALKSLKQCGYSCYRWRADDGEYESDPSVLVERTDGIPEHKIREGWKR